MLYSSLQRRLSFGAAAEEGGLRVLRAPGDAAGEEGCECMNVLFGTALHPTLRFQAEMA